MSVSNFTTYYGGEAAYEKSLLRQKAMEALAEAKALEADRKTIAVRMDEHTVCYTTPERASKLRARIAHQRIQNKRY